MPTRYLVERIKTSKPPEQIREATVNAFRRYGGGYQFTRDGFVYLHGKQGIPNGSLVNITSQFTIRKMDDDSYEVAASVSWTMNEWSIICIVLGFFIFLFWIAPILYFTFDPTQSYQYALSRVQYILEPQSGLQLR
jgi:hypothetical protein